MIAGHGRLAAANQLGLSEVPVVCLSHLNAAEKRAYILADNKIALNAGWDSELLASELEELADFCQSWIWIWISQALKLARSMRF